MEQTVVKLFKFIRALKQNLKINVKRSYLRNLKMQSQNSQFIFKSFKYN